nr:dihydropteroate synthase [Jannaschia sp. Os4]
MPLPCHPDAPGAAPLAGGWVRFDRARRLEDGATVGVGDLSAEERDILCEPRPPVAGLTWDAPRIMGILNATPDSFSDGGRTAAEVAALGAAMEADLLDVGGESTRPGAAEVPVAEEVARVVPVIEALRARAVSIDTRKAAVAEAALAAGAAIVNDVSALAFDPAMAGVVARAGVPVVLMHARGTPETMQAETDYADVVVEVLAALAGRVAAAEAAGIVRDRILVDPGIGFAKTAAQNVALLRALPALHSLGLPVLLGASRKRFIGVIGDDPEGAANRRDPGSLAVTLAGVRAGVQMHRVHDVAGTRRALRLWDAIERGT